MRRTLSLTALALALLPFLPMAASGKTKPGKKAAAKAPPNPEPTVSREELSKFLVAPAEKARKDRNYALEISLRRGIVAIRGDADDSVYALAEAWQLAGEFHAAIEELERHAEALTDDAKRKKAEAEIAKIRSLEHGLGSKFEVMPAAKEAREAFAKGRAYHTKGEYAEALLLFKAAWVLDADAVGSLRELGDVYDLFGKTDEANRFFVRYLRQRPFSKMADKVRARLAKVGLLGEVTITTSIACEEFWIARQPVKKKLPLEKVSLAPGRYRMLCYSERYSHAQYETFTVEAGKATTATFAWAIVTNRGNDPWARIWIENPDNPEQMVNVGHAEEFGVKVPDDRRALRYLMKSEDAANPQEKKGSLRLEPGGTYHLTWK